MSGQYDVNSGKTNMVKVKKKPKIISGAWIDFKKKDIKYKPDNPFEGIDGQSLKTDKTFLGDTVLIRIKTEGIPSKVQNIYIKIIDKDPVSSETLHENISVERVKKNNKNTNLFEAIIVLYNKNYQNAWSAWLGDSLFEGDEIELQFAVSSKYEFEDETFSLKKDFSEILKVYIFKFKDKEKNNDLSGMFLYAVNDSDFPKDETKEYTMLYLKDGKVYSEKEYKTYHPFEKNKYFFLASPDEVDNTKEYLKKEDFNNPIELPGDDPPQIKLQVSVSPLFVEKENTTVKIDKQYMYIIEKFDTSTNMPIEYSEVIIKTGIAYHGDSEIRKFFLLGEYYFFLSLDSLPKPDKLLHKDFCDGPFKIENKKDQEIELFKKAAISIIYNDVISNTDIPFPEDTEVKITTIDTGGTKASNTITISDPELPVIISYNSVIKGYQYILKFASETYFNVTNKSLTKKSDLGSIDFESVMVFQLPDSLSLKESKWDIKNTADYSNTDDIITKFNSIKTPLEIKLECDWLYVKFMYYSYSTKNLNVVNQLIMLEGYIHSNCKARSNLYKNGMIHLPWIEMGKGKSYLDSHTDITLKYNMDTKYNAKMPKTWDLSWETIKTWRLLFDGNRDFFEVFIQNRTTSGKPFIFTLFPDAPKYEPDKWNNAGIQNSTNCYAYAMNARTGHGAGAKAQPGDKSGTTLTALNCSQITSAVINDGGGDILTAGSTLPDEKEGYYVVALVITSITSHYLDTSTTPPTYHIADYHWYRKDVDGEWSHKPGHDPVRWEDASSHKISDPKTCNRKSVSLTTTTSGTPITVIIDYDIFCGYFYIKKGGVAVTP